METLILPFLMLILALDRHLAIENLALRQQLAVLRRQAKRPRIRPIDRSFWVILSRIWQDWKSALIVVKPETVIRWHRTGFRLLWKLKSRGGPGRPRVAPAVRKLIIPHSCINKMMNERINQQLPVYGRSVTPCLDITHGEVEELKKSHHSVYPSGKSRKAG